MKKIIFIVVCLALSGCVQKVEAPKHEAVQAKDTSPESKVEAPKSEAVQAQEEEKSVSAIVITATAPETSPPKSDEDYRKIRDQNWFERFHNNYIELLNLEDKSKRISEAEETLRKIEKAIREDDLLNSERTKELKLKSIILGE